MTLPSNASHSKTTHLIQQARGFAAAGHMIDAIDRIKLALRAIKQDSSLTSSAQDQLAMQAHKLLDQWNIRAESERRELARARWEKTKNAEEESKKPLPKLV